MIPMAVLAAPTESGWPRPCLHGGHGLRLARAPSGAPAPEAKAPWPPRWTIDFLSLLGFWTPRSGQSLSFLVTRERPLWPRAW